MARVVSSGEKQGIMILIGIILLPIIVFVGLVVLRNNNDDKYGDTVITHTGTIVDVQLRYMDEDFYREEDKIKLDNGLTITLSDRVHKFHTRSVGNEVTVYEIDNSYDYSFSALANHKNVESHFYIFIAIFVVFLLVLLGIAIRFIMGKSMF